MNLQKIILSLSLCLLFNLSYSQKQRYFRLGVESNNYYYVDDEEIGGFKDDHQLRSTNYLNARYTFGDLTATLQIESYESEPPLNIYPKHMGTDVGFFSLAYHKKNIDVKIGHFYQQFGSGLILRSWEDRTMGINNALRGVNINYRPSPFLELIALYARQRDGFEVSKGDVFGVNAEISISDLLNKETYFLNFGFSYVGRYEDLPIENAAFDPLTNMFSVRVDFSKNLIYSSFEYLSKKKDVFIQQNHLFEDKYFDGNALLFNLGYAKSGFSVDATFRRIENMSFFSERKQNGNVYNQGVVNFVPALTKQYDYSLMNLYVYQAQPDLKLFEIGQAGEIGGQIDFYYKIKKGTFLGGKNGVKLSANIANWYGLKSDYNVEEGTYSLEGFFGFGEEFYRDMGLEIRKKWTNKWSSIFTVVNTVYNKRIIESATGTVRATAIAVETTCKLRQAKSIKIEAQKLFSNDKDIEREKNWYAGMIEYNLNHHLSFYLSDQYNYSNSSEKIHYYNIGGSYKKKAIRVALNYGRQRGGLVCTGGVCRYVQKNTGLTLSVFGSF